MANEAINEKMTALADEIRELSDTTDKKSLTEMITHLESANDELEAQIALIEELAYSINNLPEKGDATDSDILNDMLYKTLSSISNNELTTVMSYTFAAQSLLTTVDLPNVTRIQEHAFAHCISLSELNFPKVTQVAGSAFYRCINLETISMPNLTSAIGAYVFAYCSQLKSISLPKLRSAGGAYLFNYNRNMTTAYLPELDITTGAFQGCNALTDVYCPKTIATGNQTFQYCSQLSTLSLPQCSSIGTNVFSGCWRLLSLYLMSSQVCRLASSATFSYSPIAGYTTYTNGVLGSIYVPASLLTQYQSATNWAYFSSRFVGV